MSLRLVDCNSEDVMDFFDGVESESDEDMLDQYTPISNFEVANESHMDKTDDLPFDDAQTIDQTSAQDDSSNDVEILLEQLPPRTVTTTTINKVTVNQHAGGRTLDAAWANFQVEYDGRGNKKTAKCLKCGLTYKTPKVERLKVHLAKCFNMTQMIDDKNQNSTNPSTSKSADKVNCEKQQWLHHVEPLAISAKAKQPSLVQVCNKIYDNKQNIDLQLARFIFSSLSPFNMVENGQFIKFCKTMRPSYAPPSSKRFSTTLLDEVYAEVTAIVSTTCEGNFATIMQDGWTGQQGSPIISHSLNIEGKKTQFLDATCASVEKKTSEYCLELLETSIKAAQKLYKCEIGAVVTDNCNSMVSMRSKLQTKFPNIWTYGCSVHLLNLVGKDFIPAEVTEEVKSVQHYFKDHTYPRETLKLMKRKQPVIPCETRWNSHYSSLLNFLDNHTSYLEISKNDILMPDTVKVKLMDLEFFEFVRTMTVLGNPLVEAIEKLQSDQATVADAVYHWVKISNECAHILPEAGLARFRSRMETALTPFVCAAFLLHPKYRGKDLPVDFLMSGQSWLNSQNSSYQVYQIKLSLLDADTFPRTMLNDDLFSEDGLSARQWWTEVNRMIPDKLPGGFAELAEKLMMLPASTSGIERCFSTMGGIMTDLRNRLGVEKAAKICMINRFLNSKSRK